MPRKYPTNPENDPFYTELACNLVYFRKKHRLSQKELAEKIDKSPKFISLLENCPPATPCSLETLFSLARFFEIHPYELLKPRE